MIQPIGYFYLWRELFGKPIWLNSTAEQKAILITLIGMANFNGKEWEWKGEKFKADKGQFVTSLDSIVENCGKGITIQNVRSALLRFEKLGFLTNESTKTGRLITIANWEVYQAKEEAPNKDTNKEVTKNQQRGNKEVTPREEIKKVNKTKKDIYTDDFEIFYELYPNSQDKQRTFTNWKSCLKENTVAEIMKAANNYKALVESEEREQKYIKSSANFLGKDKTYKDYLGGAKGGTRPATESKPTFKLDKSKFLAKSEDTDYGDLPD